MTEPVPLPVPQRNQIGDVNLHHAPGMGYLAHRPHHCFRDHPAHRRGGDPFFVTIGCHRLNSIVRAGRSVGSGGGFQESEHVVAGYATPKASAGYAAHVNAVLTGQATHGGGQEVRGSFDVNVRLGGHDHRLWDLGLRRRDSRGQRPGPCCIGNRRGGFLGQRLHCRTAGRSNRPRIGDEVRSWRGRRRCRGGGYRRRPDGHGHSGGGCRIVWWLSGRRTPFVGFHLSNGSAHRHSFTFSGNNAQQLPSHRRGNFHRHLVGYNFDQWVVAFYPIARLFQPFANRAFNDTLANVGKFDEFGHYEFLYGASSRCWPVKTARLSRDGSVSKQPTGAVRKRWPPGWACKHLPESERTASSGHQGHTIGRSAHPDTQTLHLPRERQSPRQYRR